MEANEPIRKPVEKLLLNADEVGALLGYKKTAIYEMDSDGRLGPMPIRLSKRGRKWCRQEIVEWANSGCLPRDKWQAIKKMQKN